jgi:hypothetical protein
VQHRVYGWSWRCLSTNCPMNEGPMKHSFRLFCELRHCSARKGIQLVRVRWPSLAEVDI